MRSSKSCARPTVSLQPRVLLTTLVVKLAVMAALATMLVRYRRFRHPHLRAARLGDRLILALALGSPHRGRRPASPPQLQRGGPHARRRLRRRPHRGPVCRRHCRPARRSSTAGQRRDHRPALRGRMRLCRRRPARVVPKEAIWHFSPFDVTRSPVRIWQMLRVRQVDWQVVLLMAPVALRTDPPGPRRPLERAPPPVLSAA